MKIRELLCGICLIAFVAGNAHAQGAAPGANSPPVDHPPIDGTAKTPDSANTLPEIIKPPGAHGDVIQPKTAEDPGAVVKPPNVDPGMQVTRPINPGVDQKKVVPK
jgi:hypothetical protein